MKAQYFPKVHPGCGGKMEILPGDEKRAQCGDCHELIWSVTVPDPAWGKDVLMTPPLDVMAMIRQNEEGRDRQ